jgi:hypothetical protein
VLTRVVTLVVAAGFVVVGSAGSASAWENTISGTVECATGGGWAVTWEVVNSEDEPETITESNRSVVPVGTVLDDEETRTFTETITTRPTADVELTLTAEWDDGDETSTDSGSIPVKKFSEDCAIVTITPPTVPTVDECGPGNAHFGPVPAGPWTATTNPDGSLTVTAAPGNVFSNGQTSITYPAPTDSNAPCPVVAPPEVLPAEVRVVRANARHIDKCGRASDMFRVAKRTGVVYRAGGKVLRQGVWVKATTRRVTVRARAADATYRLTGKDVWRLTFSNRPCAQPPETAPNTGF